MHARICPRSFLTWLIRIIVILFIGNLFSMFAKHYLGHDVMMGLVPLFSFNAEANIPTFFSSLMMLFSSLLALAVATKQRDRELSFLPWMGLCLIFAFLAVDEFASLHERLTTIVRITLNTSGYFYYAWVIPYGIAGMLFLAAYAKFLLTLPTSIMWLFMISGSVFVAGAVGMELLGGWHEDKIGTNTITYSLLFTLEELLEMLGIALYIFALQRFIVLEFGSLSWELRETQ